jgi:hypothetical protein
LRPLKVWNGETNAVEDRRMLIGIPTFPNFFQHSNL